MWMFDAGVCGHMHASEEPVVSLDALRELKSLLTNACHPLSASDPVLRLVPDCELRVIQVSEHYCRGLRFRRAGGLRGGLWEGFGLHSEGHVLEHKALHSSRASHDNSNVSDFTQAAKCPAHAPESPRFDLQGTPHDRAIRRLAMELKAREGLMGLFHAGISWRALGCLVDLSTPVLVEHEKSIKIGHSRFVPDLVVRCPRTGRILLVIEVWHTHAVSGRKKAAFQAAGSHGLKSGRGTSSRGTGNVRCQCSIGADPDYRTDRNSSTFLTSFQHRETTIRRSGYLQAPARAGTT
jgi:hypothetical protein